MCVMHAVMQGGICSVLCFLLCFDVFSIECVLYRMCSVHNEISMLCFLLCFESLFGLVRMKYVSERSTFCFLLFVLWPGENCQE